MQFAILIYDEPDKDINFHRWRFGRVMDRFK